MRVTRLLAIAATACAVPAISLALEPNEIFKRADPSVVVIEAADKTGKGLVQGSGVIVAARDVVTNCHIVRDASRISVKQGDVQRSARLRYEDTARDLCQVALDDSFPSGKPVSAMVPSDKVEVGQQVFAIGSPMGLDHTISRGIVSGLRGQKNGARLIQTDAAVAKGSSGGGLFDIEGRLVGIVTFGIAEGNLNFAVPTDWIAELSTRNRDRSVEVPAQPAAVAAAMEVGDGRWYPAKGDRWRYRQLDGRRAVGTVNVEVIEASSGRVRERITKEGSRDFSVERDISPDFSAKAFLPSVILPGGYKLLELSAYFPPNSDLGSHTLPRQIPGQLELLGHGKRNLVWDARVVGKERVSVPAGEFEAWKINATAVADTRHGPMKFTYQVWYSQSMQRAVKIFLDINSPLNIEKGSETMELAAFEKHQ
jgi:hypothetical protein